MVNVVFGFDVEDTVNPESDDALLDLAKLFAEEDVPACMFMVGEKARMLRERGRRDVLDALARHEMCYHGNYWGDFPEPAMVYGTRLPWDEAVSFALSVEAPGLHEIAEITGQFPVAWCCHQAQQCPPMAYAMKLAGVRCWAGGPRGYIMDWHSFSRSGCVVSGQGTWNHVTDPLDRSKRKPPLDPAADLRTFQERFESMAERLDFISVVGHPTCWAFAEWWGWYEWPRMFATGTPGPYPRGRRFAGAQPRTEADRGAALELTRRIVRWLKGRSDVRITTYTELCDEEAEPEPVWVTRAQLLDMARRVRRDMTYLNDYGTSFSPADVLYLLCHAIERLWETASWPEQQQVHRVLGPVDTVRGIESRVDLERSNLIPAAINAYHHMLDHGRLPHVVRARRHDLGPGDLLRVAADFVLAGAEGGPLPDSVAVEPGAQLPAAATEPVITMRRFGSSSLPAHFDDSRLWELLRLQSWSYRPAVRRA